MIPPRVGAGRVRGWCTYRGRTTWRGQLLSSNEFPCLNLLLSNIDGCRRAPLISVTPELMGFLSKGNTLAFDCRPVVADVQFPRGIWKC